MHQRVPTQTELLKLVNKQIEGRGETWGKVGEAADVSIRKFRAFIFLFELRNFTSTLDLNEKLLIDSAQSLHAINASGEKTINRQQLKTCKTLPLFSPPFLPCSLIRRYQQIESRNRNGKKEAFLLTRN